MSSKSLTVQQRKSIFHALVSAQDIAGVSVMEVVTQRKEPDWFTLLMPLLGGAGVLVGGRGAGRRAMSGSIRDFNISE